MADWRRPLEIVVCLSAGALCGLLLCSARPLPAPVTQHVGLDMTEREGGRARERKRMSRGRVNKNLGRKGVSTVKGVLFGLSSCLPFSVTFYEWS